MAQQGVARGNQPWFYYFFMMPLYEPLALLFGTIAGVIILWRAFRFGFRRPHKVVWMPVSELGRVGQTAVPATLPAIPMTNSIRRTLARCQG